MLSTAADDDNNDDSDHEEEDDEDDDYESTRELLFLHFLVPTTFHVVSSHIVVDLLA